MTSDDQPLRRPGFLALFVAIGAQILAGRMIRIHAWPEILVPADLLAHGWSLYREILTVHPPLAFLLVAGAIRSFGVGDGVIRALALAPALASQLGIWFAARHLDWPVRAWQTAALFFIATFLLWDGNSVYLEVFIAPLTIPLYLWIRARRTGDLMRAAALLGILLTIKQTVIFAAFAFLAGIRRVPIRRRAILAAVAAAPMAAWLAVFAVAGSGASLFHWVAVVPLTAYRGATLRLPSPGEWNFLLLGLLPVGAFWLARATRLPRALAPALAAGFLLMAWPHFELVHLTAAAPGLALLAGDSVSGSSRGRLKGVLSGVLLATSIGASAALLATDDWNGAIEFWHSKPDDRLTAWLSRLPPAPLYLYGVDQDVFVRSARRPPGRVYVNPELWFNFLSPGVEARQIAALRSHPQTIVLAGAPVPAGAGGRELARFLSASYRPCGQPVAGTTRLCPIEPGETRIRPAEPGTSGP